MEGERRMEKEKSKCPVKLQKAGLKINKRKKVSSGNAKVFSAH